MSTMTLAWWVLSVLAVGGALAVVFARDVLRMVAGLAAFLLSVAGFFLLYGMSFLAAAQVFVYVGGVLVMMLFAIMVIGRDAHGRPEMGSRFDLAAFVVAGGLFFIMQWTLAGSAPSVPEVVSDAGSVELLGSTLLSSMLPHFEFLGAMLLVALVAVIAVGTGRDE